MCGLWAIFMVTKIFADFLVRSTAAREAIKETFRRNFQPLTTLLIIATIAMGLSRVPVVSNSILNADLYNFNPESGWTSVHLDSAKFSVQVIRTDNDYQIKVSEAIRLRIAPSEKCSEFQFSVFEIERNRQADRLITSGQSINGEDFILSLQPGNFQFSYRTLVENTCYLQFDFAKESKFTSIPGAFFLGRFENQGAHELSKRDVSGTNISALPASIRLVPKVFNGRIVNTKYVAYGLENLKPHLARNESARKLGFTGEGYMLRDIEGFRYMNTMGAKSLHVNGTLKFGNVGFLNSSIKDGNQNVIKPVDVEFTYLRPGSPRHFDFCFPLTMNNSYQFTIFQFQDQYGFGSTQYSNLNFQMNRLSCEEIGYNFQVGVRNNL